MEGSCQSSVILFVSCTWEKERKGNHSTEHYEAVPAKGETFSSSVVFHPNSYLRPPLLFPFKS